MVTLGTRIRTRKQPSFATTSKPLQAFVKPYDILKSRFTKNPDIFYL